MPEHVHLILVPGEIKVPNILRSLKQPVAQRSIRRWREVNSPVLQQIEVGEGYRFWQAGGGYDRNLRDPDALRQSIDYIHWNPVKRKLVERPEEWKWSSAQWYAGNQEGQIPIDRIPS